MDGRFIYLSIYLLCLRRFSVDAVKYVRDWWKIKLSFSVCLRRTATGPGCLVERGRRLARSLRQTRRDELSTNENATGECPTKWSGWWRNKCMPPWVTAEMRSLSRVLVGWIFNSTATTSFAEGCQRIHREPGEVCDTFIPDFWEEGIKLLSPIAVWSQINAWSVKWLKQTITLAIICYVTVWTLPARGERHAPARPTVLSCRHSREAMRRKSSWLTGFKATHRYLTDHPPAISFTFVVFSFFMGPWRRLGCTGCTTVTYATVSWSCHFCFVFFCFCELYHCGWTL